MSLGYTKRARRISDEDRAGLIFGGILALVGFGVGLYYLSTSSGRKKMEEIRSRAIEARDDVLSKLEDLGEDEYEEILLEVFKLYRRLKEAETEKDFEKIALDLKHNFKDLGKTKKVRGKTARTAKGKKAKRSTKKVTEGKSGRGSSKKKSPKNKKSPKSTE